MSIKGKLHVGEGDEVDHYILDERFNIVAIAGGIPPEVRQRLVACWNEHDGLVHDNARLYESLNSEMRARIEAEKERDELVVALRKFNHDVLEEFAYAPNPGEVEAILAKYPEAS